MYTKGFTLIETILYIALFGLLMVGVVVASLQLIEAAQSDVIAQETELEGDFVLHKIGWALNGVTTNTVPNASEPYSSSLEVVSNNGMPIFIQYNAVTKKIEMSEYDREPEPITTDRAQVENIQFHYIKAEGVSPSGVEASTTINGVVFYTKRYIRK